MLTIVGLIVALVAVTVVLTVLTSAGGTHERRFAVLGQRIGGKLIPVRDRGRGNGVGMAERYWPAAAPATPGVASAKHVVARVNSSKTVYREVENSETRSR